MNPHEGRPVCHVPNFQLFVMVNLRATITKNDKILQTTRPLMPREVTDCLHNGQLKPCGLGEEKKT